MQPIETKDIVERIHKYKTKRHVNLGTKNQSICIINCFLRFLVEEVSKGEIVEIPKFGEIYLEKHPTGGEVYKPKNKFKKIETNWNHFNYWFSIDFKAKVLEHTGMKFKACGSFGKKVNSFLKRETSNMI